MSDVDVRVAVGMEEVEEEWTLRTAVEASERVMAAVMVAGDVVMLGRLTGWWVMRLGSDAESVNLPTLSEAREDVEPTDEALVAVMGLGRETGNANPLDMMRLCERAWDAGCCCCC